MEKLIQTNCGVSNIVETNYKVFYKSSKTFEPTNPQSIKTVFKITETSDIDIIDEIKLIFTNKDDINLISSVKISIGSCDYDITKNFIDIIKEIYDLSYESNNKYYIPISTVFFTKGKSFPLYNIIYHPLIISITFREFIKESCSLQIDYSEIKNKSNNNEHFLIKNIKQDRFKCKENIFYKPDCLHVSSIILHNDDFSDSLVSVSLFKDNEIIACYQSNEIIREHNKKFYIISFDDKLKNIDNAKSINFAKNNINLVIKSQNKECFYNIYFICNNICVIGSGMCHQMFNS